MSVVTVEEVLEDRQEQADDHRDEQAAGERRRARRERSSQPHGPAFRKLDGGDRDEVARPRRFLPSPSSTLRDADLAEAEDPGERPDEREEREREATAP